jgi:hypothetical protein
MIRYAIFVSALLLAIATVAAVFWAIVDGRRGRHVAPPRLPYLDRFDAPRVTFYIGRPQPTPSDFADIAAANADADLDFSAYAELYLVPEETR